MPPGAALERRALDESVPGWTRLAICEAASTAPKAIAKVVTDILATVPMMRVYVDDNRSTDPTAEVPAAAGAIGREERLSRLVL